MRKILYAIVGTAMLWPAYAGAEIEEMEIRLPSPNNPNYLEAVFYNHFIEKVDELSDGKITITPYWNSALGPTREIFETTSLGLNELATGSYSNIAHITTVMEPFQLPFLFSSWSQIVAAHSDQELRENYINPELEKVNLRLIFTFPYTPRQLYTTDSVQVERLEDMDGLQIRVAGSPFEAAMIQAFGARAVKIGWGETLDSMRTGLVDGLGVPADVGYTAKLWDTIKYIGILNTIGYGQGGFVNLQWWEGLDPEVQEVLLEAGRSAEAHWAEHSIDVMNQNVAKGIEEGLVVYGFQPEERERFEEAARATWSQFPELAPPEVIEMILEAAGPDDGRGFRIEY